MSGRRKRAERGGGRGRQRSYRPRGGDREFGSGRPTTTEGRDPTSSSSSRYTNVPAFQLPLRDRAREDRGDTYHPGYARREEEEPAPRAAAAADYQSQVLDHPSERLQILYEARRDLDFEIVNTEIGLERRQYQYDMERDSRSRR